MSNIFRQATSGLHDSPLIIAIFLAALSAFVVGMVFFVEDTMSSYYGYQQLVANYGVVPAIFGITWVALSLAPQIGILISGYMWMQNTRQAKFFWIAAGLLFLDFFSDWWHRSNSGQLIINAVDAISYAATGNGTYVPLGDALAAVTISAAFTFMAFTIGAEFFIVVGVGIMGESYVSFFRQWGKLRAGVKRGLAEAREAASGAPTRNSTHTRP